MNLHQKGLGVAGNPCFPPLPPSLERAGLNNGAIPGFDSYLQDSKVDIVGKYVVWEHLDLVAVQVPGN